MGDKDFENYSHWIDEEQNTKQSNNIGHIEENQANMFEDTKEDSINRTDDKNSDENNTNYGKDIMEMIIYFAIVICSVLLIHQFVGQQIEVSGSSMESTLHDEDHLILEKLSYHFGDPKRFDIIVFRPYPGDKEVYYIKRVIGLPGEKVQIIGSDIYIDEELLEEDYGYEEIADGGIAVDSFVLKEDEYFVLGDNRNNSKDSRDPSIGPVHKSSVMGRAWLRIWPLKDIGVLEHQ